MVAPKRILALGAGALLLLCLIPFVATAVRTDVSRDFPIYHNNGLPDLTIDAKRFVSQMEIVDRLFDSSSCEIIEGSVGGTGYRRLLRFETTIINGGDGDDDLSLNIDGGLWGGGGNDTLVDCPGHNRLDGGPGADSCTFDPSGGSPRPAAADRLPITSKAEETEDTEQDLTRRHGGTELRSYRNLLFVRVSASPC